MCGELELKEVRGESDPQSVSQSLSSQLASLVLNSRKTPRGTLRQGLWLESDTTIPTSQPGCLWRCVAPNSTPHVLEQCSIATSSNVTSRVWGGWISINLSHIPYPRDQAKGEREGGREGSLGPRSCSDTEAQLSGRESPHLASNYQPLSTQPVTLTLLEDFSHHTVM